MIRKSLAIMISTAIIFKWFKNPPKPKGNFLTEETIRYIGNALQKKQHVAVDMFPPVKIKSQWFEPSILVSIFALVVATISFVFTAKSSMLQYRPYIGIVDTPTEVALHPSKTTRTLLWRLVLKNTGSIPAWMKVEERKCSVVTDNESIDCGFRNFGPAAGILLMPQGVSSLKGSLRDPVTVATTGTYKSETSLYLLKDVLSGKATITEHIRVSYRPSATLQPGLLSKFFGWTDKYDYEVKLRFSVPPTQNASQDRLVEPYFTMTYIKAN